MILSAVLLLSSQGLALGPCPQALPKRLACGAVGAWGCGFLCPCRPWVSEAAPRRSSGAIASVHGSQPSWMAWPRLSGSPLKVAWLDGEGRGKADERLEPLGGSEVRQRTAIAKLRTHCAESCGAIREPSEFGGTNTIPCHALSPPPTSHKKSPRAGRVPMGSDAPPCRG